MQLYHNSQQIIYRNPFGAVETGTEICMKLLASEPGYDCQALVCFWSEKDGSIKKAMSIEKKTENEICFSYTFRVPQVPQLVWYSFEVHNSMECFYYGNNPAGLGGEGTLYKEPDLPSFQITVYQPRKIPDWYKNAIAYQIFPDRFNRGSDWPQRMMNSFRKDGKGPKHIIRQEWSDNPEYRKNCRGEITHWDFFGGTLKGIEEKLNYLENLGISVIYLNPIFEASSNHRYDTADFMKIDPRLGDEEAFISLCKKAGEHGISIILDGVFNHSGCDSIYFDQYGTYGGMGAWKNKDSKYFSWYKFKDDEHKECEYWWGTKDLPVFDKENKDYQNFIYKDSDSVIKHWLLSGAKGWRLDVADELPDKFIEGIKTAVTEASPEGILLGEVWEDASNKISYGKMRKYLLGSELDAVMNYPFRTIMTDFLMGNCSAQKSVQRMMSLYENYPRTSFYSSLNIIGSHDRIRILSFLGKGPEAENASGNSKEYFELSPREYDLAINRLRLLVLMQMTHPGVPCIYYGDEIGMEGGTDPYNRAPYPWDRQNERIKQIYHTMIALRKEYPVFTNGSFAPFSICDDIYGYKRTDDRDEIIILINRCPYHSVTATIETQGRNALNLLTASLLYAAGDAKISIELGAFEAAVLRLEDQATKHCRIKRGAGVLCHISSIASDFGTGQFGKETKEFIDRLAAAGQKYWQILPLNPTDSYGSSYSSFSAFAGNEGFINLNELVSQKLLNEITDNKIDESDQRAVLTLKQECLYRAYCQFKPDEKYKMFCKDNSFWLDDYCIYRALKERFPDTCWQEWPQRYRDYDTSICKDEELMKRASFHRFCQFIFECQWQEVKKYANENGIKIIGDLPFYMKDDSADVWTHRDLFQLNAEGYLGESAGVPPDYFSADGQIWNVPTYRWKVIESEGFEWWIQRLKQAIQRYDYVRLDHFRGFEQYWAIPCGSPAMDGHWTFGPGRRLFDRLKQKLGTLPIIAEDLGRITVEVNDFTYLCGFMGMDVFQFSSDERYHERSYNAKHHAVLYSGTHDNETLKGWCISNHLDCNESLEIIKALYQSDAPIVILPMQDVLGLDNNARMNTPGTTENNWKWRFQIESFNDNIISFYKNLAIASER